MNANYQKLYAYLFGQIDDAIQMIAGDLVDGKTGRDELCAVGEKLKNALLVAEDMYMDAEN